MGIEIKLTEAVITRAITTSARKITEPLNITLLTLSVLFLGSFVAWVGRQERRNRPALVPNSFWKNRIFTSICLSVFLVWGAFNATETMDSFYFQYVQHLSAMDSSMRFLPAPIGGVLASVAAAFTVHRVRADTAIIISITVSCLSPILMAINNPAWSYWMCIFPAGVAGGVYNTMAQIGKSVGLASTAALASAVTASSQDENQASTTALLQGYRAAFWYCLALNATTLLVALWGLRKVGKVGAKHE
ncbi:hypothetical protein ColTof3_08295 [Colletotrichum tofieldiae]|nr:hypothetical protein ColTof3_08295 [Colletotrichum tofieldiae]